jgi:hypothetical protein
LKFTNLSNGAIIRGAEDPDATCGRVAKKQGQPKQLRVDIDACVIGAAYCAPVRSGPLRHRPIHDPQEVPHEDIQHCPHVGRRLSLRTRNR